MLNYNKLGDANFVISAIVASQPATEMTAAKKALYDDMNFDNMLEASEGSISPTTGKGKLVVKLWDDCMKDYTKGFGVIPKSMGDVTKFDQYDTLKLCIDFVNKMDSDYQLSTKLAPATNYGMTQTNIQRMNKLHNILITYHADFIYGFRSANNFIKNAYCVLVASLIDITCINLAAVTNYVDMMPGEHINAVTVRYGREQTKFAHTIDKLCMLFDDGSWSKLMREIRKMGTKSFLGESTGVIVILAGIPIVVTAILYMIRALIAFYYSSAVTVNEKCKAMAEYIDEASKNNTDNPSAMYKQNKAKHKLESISGFIQSKIIKETEAGEARMKEADQQLVATTYVSPQERDAFNKSGSAIEFDF